MSLRSKTTIVFICGCLEPGKDGVGDYTRVLATELQQRGANCRMFALFDQHVGDIQDELQSGIQTLRLCATMPTKDKAVFLQRTLQGLGSYQVVLQYVPFAYHHKGLPFDLLRHLESTFNRQKIHWMCHEIWCGLSIESKFKERVLGWLQMRLLAKHLRRAASVATSNPDYQERLHRLTGKTIEPLPLFGNIPFNRSERQMPSRGAQDRPINIVLFGRIATDFPAERALRAINGALCNAKRSCVITSIGRIDRGESAWKNFTRHEFPCISFSRRGELPPEEIDRAIQLADFGLSTTPLEGIGKSGTSIAILERGVPIIGCLQRGGPIGVFPNLFPQNQILTIDCVSANDFKEPSVFEPRSMLTEVANRQLAILGL